MQRNDEVQRSHQRQRVAANETLGHDHEMPTQALAGHEREGGGHDEEHAEQVGPIDEEPVLAALVIGAQIQHGEEKGLVATETEDGVARLAQTRKRHRRHEPPFLSRIDNGVFYRNQAHRFSPTGTSDEMNRLWQNEEKRR